MVACRKREVAPPLDPTSVPLGEEVRFRSTDKTRPIEHTAFAVGADDGATYIADLRNVRFLAYKPDGTFLQVIGGRGKEPGQFVAPLSAGLTGDTLWVYDAFGDRVTYFAKGAVAGTEKVARPPVKLRSTVEAALRLADSTFLWTVPKEAAKDGSETDPVRQYLVRYSRAGKPVDTITSFTCAHDAVLAPGAQGVKATIVDMPITRCDITTADPRGAYVYHISDLAPGSPDSSDFTVTRWSPKGGIAWKRAYSYLPKKLTRGFADSAAMSRLSPDAVRAVPNTPEAKMETKLSEAIMAQEYHPAIYRAVASTDGTLYIERERTGGRSVWMRINPDGEPAGSIEITGNRKLLAANGSYIWTIGRDENNQAEIVRYRVGAVR
jgi:hypothetical protein